MWKFIFADTVKIQVSWAFILVDHNFLWREYDFELKTYSDMIYDLKNFMH